MLQIDLEKHEFAALGTPTLSEVSMSERYDLQECIYNSPAAFFSEVGETLFLIGKEVRPSETLLERIDLLCIDPSGALVVVELKRDTHRLHLLQAVSYAGMLAGWTADDVLGRLDDERQDELQDFLDGGLDTLNASQRILLFAEGYDLALLSGAEWLHEQYGVPITCCRMQIAEDAGSTYLACSIAYPPPELGDQAIARGRQPSGAVRADRWSDWEAAYESTNNLDVAEFFRTYVEAKKENDLKYRVLYFRIDGKRRLAAYVRTKYATAVQLGRFSGDTDFWKSRLSKPDSIRARGHDSELTFALYSRSDFDAFKKAAESDLLMNNWEESLSPVSAPEDAIASQPSTTEGSAE